MIAFFASCAKPGDAAANAAKAAIVIAPIHRMSSPFLVRAKRSAC